MSRISTRGVSGIVKRATNFLSEVPGGETLVLQAVRDMLSELRDLRRENVRLVKRIEVLEDRLERERLKRSIVAATTNRRKPAASKRTAAGTARGSKRAGAGTRKAAPAKRTTRPRRQKGLIESAVDAAERIL